ncbi:MAG: hypothetical protein COT73_04550 [Bdellovibrio sp. CG10_big_fil_rev_8_21_14_0_10_47_8]|nr:MAG: hypothetical protein COT73_04550 [Bdellovibrio sp. CG10_big_fil_rev_8_21_14_0_10_47_8]
MIRKFLPRLAIAGFQRSLCLSALCFLLVAICSPHAHAQDLNRHYLLAQADVDDSYDPFSDYSEFDEASDEEADIDFFRHGRFLSFGFAFGLRGFTDELSRLYSSGPAYGLYLSYFFDMRMAMELGFNTGDHDFQASTSTESLSGNVSMTFIHLNLKYYFNTQNMKRGLSDINPYVLGGFSQVYRTYTIEGSDVASRESTVGMNFGLGVEVPIMRKKAYVGAQAVYHYINFKDENANIVNQTTGVDYGVKPRGDAFDVLALIGLSF